MADEPFSLKHLFEFFVPSQCRCTEALSDEIRQEVLKEVKTRMAKWFGGFTVTDARGGWVLASGDLAEEPVSIVYSNSTDESLSEYKKDFITFAEAMATRLSQEAIGYRIDGQMFFAEGDASQPCLHKQARFKKGDRRELEVVLRYQSLQEALRRLCGSKVEQRLEALFSLFTYTLGYDFVNKPVATPNWSEELRQLLLGREAPKVIAQSASGFKIILIRLQDSRLLLTEQRQVIERLLHDDRTLRALFVVTDGACSHWHFVNVPENAPDNRRLLRRFRIESANQPMRTIVEQFSLLDLQKIGLNASVLVIKEVHDSAFDVESITQEFYRQYKALFDILQADLQKQTKDRAWAHDFVLQFLNRLMFIYFIQRKRWLGDDPDFLRNFWAAYTRSQQPMDSFVKGWLSVLFFEAFNEKFHGGYDYFPDNIRKALQLAPYLNGGLFSRNDLDDKHVGKYLITDAHMSRTIAFLERFNFTVSEDTPLDQEVAVDAEMLGKVYESLVNVSEETDERSDAGIFYTPRTEIDMMCRLSLVDYLANHLGTEQKPLLYEAVFACTVEEKTAVDEKLCNQDLWGELDRLLQNITVVDPACGSGSFLIGMLQVLDDLAERANRILGREETPYQRRKRIIGQSLYGVDVMRWAVDVAELRLWLQLVVETDLKPAERKFRPLLPNLTFKIRRGDSLVQELGGINMAHIKGTQAIPPVLKGRLTKLKGEKLKFYNNEFQSKFDSLNDIEREERRLFQDILESRKHTLENRLKETKSALVTDTDLLGEKTSRLGGKQRHDVEAETKTIAAELALTKKALAALARAKETPFVWDIAFVEIFTGEHSGFDIVIGNPPFVCQENISDPMLAHEKVSIEAKKAYKGKLIRSVYRLWPSFFGIDPERPTYKLNAKSDLYVYFFFHGLALLNTKGSFCFITSNSWLDVGYGKDLQEFLLKHGHVKMVLDNQNRRTFESADVNTVITLLAAPDKRPATADTKVARFILFTVPFEQILTHEVFTAIEVAEERCFTPEYRLFPICQKTLFEQGCNAPEEEDNGGTSVAAKGKTRSPLITVAQYAGNKWGGKYLRAPDIYWTLLKKGEAYIQPLSDYFSGERYLNTGGADGFFILTDVERINEKIFRVANSCGSNKFVGEIEEKFLVPLIKDVTKEDKRIQIERHDAYCLVVETSPSSRLKKYIAWGEEQGYNNRSVTKNQHPWYKPTNQMLSSAQVLLPRSFSDTFVIYQNPKGYLSLRFYRLHPHQGKEDILSAFLNTTLFAFFIETLGNKSLGQGVLDIFMADFLRMRVPVVLDSALSHPYKMINKRPIKKIHEELGLCEDTGVFSPRNDRLLLDSVVFDALELTKGEREAVYESLIDMVNARLQKANSLNS